MDAKVLRIDPVLVHRNDGLNNYAHGGSETNCSDRATFHENSTANSLSKMETQNAQPCPVLGPDRIITQSLPMSSASMKRVQVDSWGLPDNGYRKPPDYHQKFVESQLPSRNISPRQTFQENMSRIIVPPRINTSKVNENTPNAIVSDNKGFLSKNVPLDQKYYDVPYNVNTDISELRSVGRNPELCMPNINPSLMRSSAHNWPLSGNADSVQQTQPYNAPDKFNYPDYNSNPRPIAMGRPLRPGEAMGPYSDPYCRSGNIRFEPYPKDRYQNPRYEYISNYPNPYHTANFPLQQPPHKYGLQKPFVPNHYVGYPQMPYKYIEPRLQEPHLDNYHHQRLNQPPSYNFAYHGQSYPPNYIHNTGTCLPNKSYPYTEKAAQSPKNLYDTNKIIIDYDPIQAKKVADSAFINEDRPHSLKASMMMPNFTPLNMHGGHIHNSTTHYRKENPIKNYEYMLHYKKIDVNTNNPYARVPPQFSPNMVSPSDSSTSNDAIQALGLSQEDCGYVSQSSTVSSRSGDYGYKYQNQESLRRYDNRYGPSVFRSPITKEMIHKNATNNNNKGNIDVRQFLQMWNEGEDEYSDNPKDSAMSSYNSSSLTKNMTSNQEELYVLGLVNVPKEELSKYEHIQKVSKLPENIKGYSNLELLHQFEEVTGTAKLNSNVPIKSRSESRIVPVQNTSNRPLSPLDVEAKISQSVIHKEVGCNFEIKPCSPLMLNVEVAASAQALLGERTIEKVTNPVNHVPSIHQHRESCINDQDKIGEVIPSCKLLNSPYNNDAVRHNYNIQDFESNSGICLASLPRLDTDIELNFTEVNQQFIDANKNERETTKTVSTSLASEYNKDSKIVKSDINSSEGSNTYASVCDSDYNVTKLSKFRKSKLSKKDAQNNTVNYIQGQRKNSVIIKNPDNVEKATVPIDTSIMCEEFKNLENVNISDKSKDINEIMNFESSEQQSLTPMNLTFPNKINNPLQIKDSNIHHDSNNGKDNLLTVGNVDIHGAINLSLNNISQNDSNFDSDILGPQSKTVINFIKDDYNSDVTNSRNISETNEIEIKADFDLSNSVIDPISNNDCTESFFKSTNEDLIKSDILNSVEGINENEFVESIDLPNATCSTIDILENDVSRKEVIIEKSTNFDDNLSADIKDTMDKAENITLQVGKYSDLKENLEAIDMTDTERNYNKNNIAQILKSNESARNEEINVDNISLGENKLIVQQDDEKCNEIAFNLNKNKDVCPLETFERTINEVQEFEENFDTSKSVNCSSSNESNVDVSSQQKINVQEGLSLDSGKIKENNKDVLFEDKLAVAVNNADDRNMISGESDSFESHTQIIPEADDQDEGNNSQLKITTEVLISDSINRNNQLNFEKMPDSPVHHIHTKKSNRIDYNLGDKSSNLSTCSYLAKKVDCETSCGDSKTNNDIHKIKNILNSESELDEKAYDYHSLININLKTTANETIENSDNNNIINTEAVDTNTSNEISVNHSKVESTAKSVEIVNKCENHLLNLYIFKTNIDYDVIDTAKEQVSVDVLCSTQDNTLIELTKNEKDIARLETDDAKSVNTVTCESKIKHNYLKNIMTFDWGLKKELRSLTFQKLITKEVGYCNKYLNNDAVKIITQESETNVDHLNNGECIRLSDKLPVCDKVNEDQNDNFNINEGDTVVTIDNVLNNDSNNNQNISDISENFNSEAISPGNIDSIDAKKITELSVKDYHCSVSTESGPVENSNSINKNNESREQEKQLNTQDEDNEIDFGNSINKIRPKTLKRSLSDSSLYVNNCNNMHANDLLQCEHIGRNAPLGRYNKRKKFSVYDENVNTDIIESRILQGTRRNSTSIIHEEDISFCIYITDDCIISEDLQEDTCNSINIKDISINDSCDNVLELNDRIFESCENPADNITFETVEENALWVDVACVETVISNNICEDSNSTSPCQSPLLSSANCDYSDDITECENNELFNMNVHSDKIKHIYGDNMGMDDIKIVETLYRTPQMNVNNKLNDRESQLELVKDFEMCDESLENPCNENMVQCDTDLHVSQKSLDLNKPCNDSCDYDLFSNHSDEEFINVSDGISEVPLKCVKNTSTIEEINLKNKTQYDTIHSCESSNDDLILNDQDIDKCINCSSSPEVTSTTTEERKSGILLKITNYKGSRVSVVEDVSEKSQIVEKKLRCKFTELTHYVTSESSKATPLITKAAKKYIPPLKQFDNFIVKLKLPPENLLRLKQLKTAKDKPKITPEQKLYKYQNEIQKVTIKKFKPNFGDVLKDIDVQYKLHKVKQKKIKEHIPKVVIKKNENGSHYASTSNKEHIPDMTGRKWQPWVFIEKDIFIDKMALKNKTKAIFCHRKNTYILYDKFSNAKRRKVVYNTANILSEPNLNNPTKVPLKYTIRLKSTN